MSACAAHQPEMQHMPDTPTEIIASAPGLVAFWDFQHARDGQWIAYSDPAVSTNPYPLRLRRIGDSKSYTLASWPYTDPDSKIVYDQSGPFGQAVRFNQGFIYGTVEREAFDQTPLDLHGEQPFTLIAWVKFIGHRHMVAGIWDEGGWDKYGGRRQAALFGGLFGQKGVIAHISATGAASYPQSNAPGAQYARCRAIDGASFADNQWIAMAMTYDPERHEVVAYLNGKATPCKLTDPVAQHALDVPNGLSANPFSFPYPVYSPRAFVIKYNGYENLEDRITEHRLYVDLPNRSLTYGRESLGDADPLPYRLFLDLRRNGTSTLAQPIEWEAIPDKPIRLPVNFNPRIHDEIYTWLEVRRGDHWEQVGTIINREILEGAPFTFGRALGLGSEDIHSGSQLYLDGVAVFNRVISLAEIERFSVLQKNAD